MKSLRFRTAVSAAAAFFSLSCPSLLSAQQEVSQAQTAAARIRADTAAAEASPYRLQRGDEIEIKAVRIPELSQQCAVRPDGRISLIRLNDVAAAGLTSTELAQKLSAEYSKLYREPEIAVIVRSFSKMDVFVGGDVTQPGGFALKGGMTATAALMRAGGLKDSARSNSVLVVRENETGTPEVISVNIDDVLTKGASDVRLQPSDVVYVPRSTVDVYVGGEVVRPGLVPVRGELTALAAISQAGGFRETARTNNVVLLRKGKDGGPEPMKLAISDLLKGKPSAALQPYDVIWVPKSTIGKVDKFVDQYMRQLIPVYLNSGFSYVLGGRMF